VVAFNVDPVFNNAVDGLMYIRVYDIQAPLGSSSGKISETELGEIKRKDKSH
jgi:hypothetical protein